MQQDVTRKLAAILAADVVGYSRLMAAEEDATIRALDTCRQVIYGLVGNHRGRVFGSAGSVEGYNYSDALRSHDFAWTPETLRDLFRDGPDAFIPDTKMPMQRIADGQALGEPIDDMRELTVPAGTDSGG